MLLSMTGFGASNVRSEGLTVLTEIKTVNNRYLKVSLRMTDGFGALESKVEGIIREKISRGTVSVWVRINRDVSMLLPQLNRPLLMSYFEQVKAIGAELGLEPPRDLGRLLSLHGVVQNEEVHSGTLLETVEPLVLASLEEALSNLQDMRRVEGNSMSTDLRENCLFLEKEITAVERLAPHVAKFYRTRLTERVGKIMNEHNLLLDTADLAREIALFADRSDISEEIVRFRSHLQQFLDVIEKGDCCGRKLDFLTQEMFRETNTIGSKANDAEITKHIIEMKAIVERIREMVQNVE
ncbi:MAG: YicC/YloC family endoribonuclease [Thermoguttaceae bacterium]